MNDDLGVALFQEIPRWDHFMVCSLNSFQELQSHSSLGRAIAVGGEVGEHNSKNSH